MNLTKHLRLCFLFACGLALPALGQDDEAAAPEDGAAAATEEAPAATEEMPAAEAVAPSDEGDAAAGDAVAPAPAKVAKAPKAQKAKAAPKADAEDESDDTGTAGDAGSASGGVSETGSGIAPAGASDTTADEKRGPYDFISEGKRLELKDGDFSIEPPTGWQVYTKEPGLTLMAMPAKDPKFKYQRTLQVAAFEGPRYMDDITAKEFEEEIPRKFQAISNAIGDYKVRNHLPVEMGDSRQGLLFYTEFKLDGVALMQAHIVVSSAANHYLLTYTDVAEHFENEAETQFLTESWASMTSVQLKGRTPMRYTSSIMLGGGLVAILLLGLLVFFVRNWRAKRSYEYYGSGKGLDDVDIKSEISSRMITKNPENPDESGVSGMTFMDDDTDKRA